MSELFVESSRCNCNEKECEITDSIVQKIVEKFLNRSKIGIRKYGKTLDRDDLELFDWINHTQEELMDAILYLERLKQKSLENVLDECLEKC